MPIQTLAPCRSICLRTPSKTPRLSAAACVAEHTPQWAGPLSYLFLNLDKHPFDLIFSLPLTLSRRHTWWSTCLNMGWWNMWCPIIHLYTGQTLLPFLYESPSSKVHKLLGFPRQTTMERQKWASIDCQCFEKRISFDGSISLSYSCWPDSIIGDIQRWFLSTFRLHAEGRKYLPVLLSRERKLAGGSSTEMTDELIFTA